MRCCPAWHLHASSGCQPVIFMQAWLPVCACWTFAWMCAHGCGCALQPMQRGTEPTLEEPLCPRPYSHGNDCGEASGSEVTAEAAAALAASYLVLGDQKYLTAAVQLYNFSTTTNASIAHTNTTGLQWHQQSWASDGVCAGSRRPAWPALLMNEARAQVERHHLPLGLACTGCQPALHPCIMVQEGNRAHSLQGCCSPTSHFLSVQGIL